MTCVSMVAQAPGDMRSGEDALRTNNIYPMRSEIELFHRHVHCGLPQIFYLAHQSPPPPAAARVMPRESVASWKSLLNTPVSDAQARLREPPKSSVYCFEPSSGSCGLPHRARLEGHSYLCSFYRTPSQQQSCAQQISNSVYASFALFGMSSSPNILRPLGM